MKILLIALTLTLTHSAMAHYAGSEPIGYYSNGSLRNAVQLPDSGPGYMKLFLERNRAWGTQEMIDLIVNSSAAMERDFPKMDRLQIGDIAKKDGGLLSDLHNSHQNGLDADVTYYRLNKVEQRLSHIDGFAENMVTGKRISKNFDSARNWEFIKHLHENGKVQRIFMDPIIKKELCRVARLKKELIRHDEVLRSIRPYENHQDHMHIRLRCPPDARECVTQEDPPAGTGCAGL